MLSNKVINFCKNNGWWFNDVSEEYSNVLLDLNISLETDFSQFYLHAEDGPTFYSRGYELYQICWFSINSHYDLDIKRTHEILKMPKQYIPLDSFEGEEGFFYNIKTGEIISFKLGEELSYLQPQWNNFNEFLEWYFELN